MHTHPGLGGVQAFKSFGLTAHKRQGLNQTPKYLLYLVQTAGRVRALV
jgi:hypothetical protein